MLITFEEFIVGMNQDERRVFDCIVEHFEAETFSTMKVGVKLGVPVDENGNGREWISRLLDKYPRIALNVGSFNRYPENPQKGTLHPGYVGPLAAVGLGYAKHKPYMLNVPKYVVREALKQLGLIDEVATIDAEMYAIRNRVAELSAKRRALTGKGIPPKRKLIFV